MGGVVDRKILTSSILNVNLNDASNLLVEILYFLKKIIFVLPYCRKIGGACY